MIAAVLAIAGRLPWKWLLLIAAVGAFLTALSVNSYHSGAEHVRAAQRAAEKAQRAKVAKTEARADKITADVGEKVEKQAAEIRYVTKTIIREIPTYVSPETDARFPLPVGLVRVYDDSLAGHLSSPADAARLSFGEASDVTASQAATVIASNNGACRAEIAKLAGWQEWWAAQAANR